MTLAYCPGLCAMMSLVTDTRQATNDSPIRATRQDATANRSGVAAMDDPRTCGDSGA